MSFNFDIDTRGYVDRILLQNASRQDEAELRAQRTEWPHCYPSLGYFYSQEAFDRAKAGWMETGKTYHLLSRDEQGNPITREYSEYFDGENRFIAVKEYDTYHLRRVQPMQWNRRNDGVLYYESSDENNLWADITDLPQNLGQTAFREDILRDYVQHIFANEINPDQRYDIDRPVLMEELRSRILSLQMENAQLSIENARLREENKHLKGEQQEGQTPKETTIDPRVAKIREIMDAGRRS